MIFLPIILLLAVAFLLLKILFKILKRPMKLAFKLLLHALFGFVFLFVFNFVGAWAGWSIELTWLNAAISGIFGIPGVIVLLIIKYIL